MPSPEIARCLSSAGYDARLFSSGEEFLANPYIRTAECLISDIDLRGMSGIDLLRRIEAQGIKLPCILLAGSGKTDRLHFYFAEGVRFLFPKPILGVELPLQ
jgi:two-component system, LuxR family, response regulator FixJ